MLANALWSAPVRAQGLQIHVINVDQGQAVFVLSPTGVRLLIDGGNPGDGNAIVKPYLQSIGVTDLDYTLMSHWHTDHFGGLTEIHNSSWEPNIAAYDRGDIDRPSNSFVTGYLNAVGAVRQIATLNQVLDLGGGCTASVIAVNGSYIGGSVNPSPEENAYSIGLVIRYGDFDFYCAGDLTAGGLGTPNVEGPATVAVGQVEFAMASHHGSPSSSSSTAVSNLNPSFVAISAGFDNPYGHPSETIVDNWNTTANARVIWCTTDGETQDSGLGGDPGGFNGVNGHMRIATDGNTFTVSSTSNPESVTCATFEQPGVLAGANQIAINEVLVDPTAGVDGVGEWWELTNVSAQTLNLGGMRFVVGAQSFTLRSQVLLEPGGHFVVGLDGRRSRNGNYFPGVCAPWQQFSLPNSTSSLQIRSQANVTLETVAWGSGGITLAPGVSAERKTPTSPPAVSNFANATSAWAAGSDLGTPWEVNDNFTGGCPAPIPYGTGKTTSNATVPYVTWTGTPSTTTNDFVVTLVDAMPLKSCIGFYGFAPSANPFFGHFLYAQTPVSRLPIQTTDINGSVSYAIPVLASMSGTKRYYQFWFRDPLVPDGTNVGLSAALEVRFCPLPQPAAAGDVIVTEFMKDPAFVGDAAGEWIELYNDHATQTIDVEGWTLHDNGVDMHVISNGGAGLSIAPGQFLVLGNNASFASNGGVNVAYAYTGFSLANTDDQIVLVSAEQVEIDRLEYDNGLLWPDTPGQSINLRPDSFDATTNDDGNYWCHATSAIGGSNPDTGTPGSLNDDCP